MLAITSSIRSYMRSGSFFLIYALVAAYLIIVPQGFPFLGLAIILAILSTLVYVGKQTKSFFVNALYIFTLLFSACVVYRANEGITSLNILATVVLGSVMSLWPTYPEEKLHLGFIQIGFAPIATLLRIFKTQYKYHFKLPSSQVLKEHAQAKFYIKNGKEIIKSVIIAGIVLVVIIPLLSSANPIFSHWVATFFGWFNIFSWLEKLLSIQSWWLWIWRAFLMILLTFFVPRLVYLAQEPTKEQFNVLKSSSLLLPKFTVALVLGIFFLSQAQLYFASETHLLELGYTHSELAREVFGQLTVVALITVALLYNDKKRQSLSKIITFILLLEAAFLTLIAFKSVYDYIGYWGLTYKRLWGLTGVIWMFGALSTYLFIYVKNLSQSFFVKSIVVLSGVTLLSINLINFDYLIYHYGQSVTHDGLDYEYLSRLSPDSLSYSEQYQLFSNLNQNQVDKTMPYDAVGSAARHISNNIIYLQKKYQHLDPRTFNLSEFKQYWAVRNLNLEAYNDRWKPIAPPGNEGSSINDPVQYAVVSQRDTVNSFPYNDQVEPGFIVMTYYYVTAPTGMGVSLSASDIIHQHVVMDDIWDQANINFDAKPVPISISPLMADKLIAGNGEGLTQYIQNDGGKSVPVIIVKNYGTNVRGNVTFNPTTGEGYILITESAFKDGKSLSQLMGYALGLNQSSQGLMSSQDQSLVLGADEIRVAKVNARKVEERLGLRG